MANYIKTLKEDNDDTTYPVTKSGAVILNDGTDLETKLTGYVTAEDLAVTSAQTPLVRTNMIADGAVTTAKIANGAVTTAKIDDGAVTSAKIDWSTIVPEVITVSDYINFTVGGGTTSGYKIGPIVVINFDRTNVSVINGEKQIGTCTSKIKMTVYGAGRAASSGDAIPATFIAIPNGAFRCHTTASRLNCAGTIWLLEA